jgi:hypothetical protein
MHPDLDQTREDLIASIWSREIGESRMVGRRHEIDHGVRRTGS